MSNAELASRFLVQCAVILGACRLVGVIARRLGQPQVVAEMVAGVCLGPSLLGFLAPDWHSWLFPWNDRIRDSQSYLYPVAQLGLALYMFVVGMDFRLDIMRSEWKSAAAVSLTGMIAPFALGAGAGVWMFRTTSLFPPGTRMIDCAVFLGTSMCITAFPMLARIIQARRLGETRMGTVSLAAGAFNDALAWCLLAVVLASLDGHVQSSMTNIAGGLLFVVVSIFVLRPLMHLCCGWMTRDGQLSETGFVVCLILLVVNALLTDLLGLHAVFGAFVAGTIIPRGMAVRDASARILPLTEVLLLPLFFTFSGLQTRIGLVNSPGLWMICGGILAIAVTGKGVACWLAARFTGVPDREATGIGILMNARGLMELIIINIGRQKGLISEELFAMLVVMAIVTTLMTSPMLDWLVVRNRPVPDGG